MKDHTIRRMRSCLGILLFLLTIMAIVLSIAYHTSLNTTLKFEPRDTNEQYINTRRSYRPPVQQAHPQTAPTTQESQEEDEIAEEV